MRRNVPLVLIRGDRYYYETVAVLEDGTVVKPSAWPPPKSPHIYDSEVIVSGKMGEFDIVHAWVDADVEAAIGYSCERDRHRTPTKLLGNGELDYFGNFLLYVNADRKIVAWIGKCPPKK